jgi:hypothetical protein
MPHQISLSATTGTPPYSVIVCDVTLIYCYTLTGSTSLSATTTFDIPSPLDVADSIIVKVIDSNGCEIFLPYSCPVTPTPTPTITPTPSSTPTDPCRCIQITNTGTTDGTFYYTQCDGTITSVLPINSGTTLYYCGSNPIPLTECDIYIGDVCVDNSCVAITPTPTPTISLTPSITPSVTPTISLTPTNTPTPSITPTISLTPTITPTNTPTISVTPTITPSVTPTSSPLPSTFAYLFIEPISAATSIGNYMYNNGAPQFYGFSNTSQPSTSSTTFNTEMNLYVNYSGWTSGELPTIISSNVPQTTGGVDSFGNAKIAYNFETTEVLQNTILDQAWFTWIIPIALTNNQSQLDIDFSLGNPNVFNNVLTESTIRTNTFTYTGSTIPSVTYRVYTTYPAGDFLIDNQTTDIYFKGGSVG